MPTINFNALCAFNETMCISQCQDPFGVFFVWLDFWFCYNQHHFNVLHHSVQYVTLRNVLLCNMLKGGCDFARQNKADLELTALEWKCKDWTGTSYFCSFFPCQNCMPRYLTFACNCVFRSFTRKLVFRFLK